MIDEWKSGCPQFVCWCFCQCTGPAHNTQQRPFKGFGRPTKAKKKKEDVAITSFDVAGPRKSGDKTRLMTYLSGSNPLVPGSPPIEWNADLTISNHVTDGYIDVSFKLQGKGFPAYESFIEDAAGTRVFLTAYQAPAKEQFAIRLLGSIFQVQTTGSIRFYTNAKGHFTGQTMQMGIRQQISVRNSYFLKIKAAADK